MKSSFAACALVVVAAVGAGCGRTKTTPAAVAEPDAGSPCGAFGCAQFDSAADAFRAIVPGDARVVAIGEAHAPRGATVPSAAKRFADDLLPVLQGRASDLLVELMMPPSGCEDATAEVRRDQAPATAAQASSNPSEYVAMGERARALGIVPDMLRPSCAELDDVRARGDDAIEASLGLIARLSTVQASRLVARDDRSSADQGKTVVLYGGMLHNDLEPAPDRRAWSYAPALDAATGGKLVAIDLVVPEFMSGDEAWRALPWVAAYDPARLGARATVFRVGERSYVLVFPQSRVVARERDVAGATHEPPGRDR